MKPTFNAIDEVKRELNRRMDAGIEEIMMEFTHKIKEFDHNKIRHREALYDVHAKLKAFFIDQIDIEELATKYQNQPLHERI